MIDIIICDDHQIVREGLKQIINNHNDLNIIADDISSGEKLLRALREKQPHVILLDISLPGRSGLEVLKQVKIFYEDIKVLVLSMYPEDQFALRMLKAGASGYLHKDAEPDTLIEAIRTVAAGDEYLSPKIMNLMYSQMNTPGGGEAPHQLLSDREYEVMLKIGEGKTISEIANQLNLSVKTISTYRSRILDKMNFDNNSDMVKYIMLHELVA